MVLLCSSNGWNRTSRKTPATTIVLEWSRADTGVGPSIADGSHGCRPNWADLPAAAITNPSRGISVILLSSMKICWRSHVLRWMVNHAMARINPISPIRLYRMACSAAVLASDREYHHPISRNDIIPTPSHPMNSWNMLFAVTRIIIATKNVKRYKKNRLMFGSECIYHIENSIIDHVTNNATGINITEK